MPRIAYGTGAYRRDAGNLVELKLINMFLEAAPQEEGGVILLSRKGLTLNTEPGDGPIEGIFRADGVFDGDLFTVTGGRLYRGETNIGAIAGTGPVSMAASDTELAITAGTTLYRYSDADGLDAVTFPDSADVIKIAFHDGLFLAGASGTQRWYYSSVLDADTWNALDFASAERKPDPLIDLAVTNDTLWLFGSESIEPWSNTGEADLPYRRFEQRVFTKGIHSTGALAELDNSIFFVGGDGMAYRLGDEGPGRVSDHGIEERIKASSTVSCFAFVNEGHAFFALRLDTATFTYDVATQQWCELQSYERDNFRGRCAAMEGGIVIFGDDEEGKTWTLSGWEDDGDPLERLFTAGFPINGGTVNVDNLLLEVNVGHTELLAGQGTNPVMEMRSSRDAGATWGNRRSAAMGEQARYRTKTVWRRCGKFDAPGALFETRCTDPVGLRVSGVFVNEPGGGRSR